MSRFTTEVRYVCEFYAGMEESGDYTDVDNTVGLAQSHIFDNYPIFDESYREFLNKKILKHYYTREICEETIGLWKLRLSNKMNEIMPYYNKLYNSELLNFNPFYDVDLQTTHNRSNGQEQERELEGSDSRNGVRNESENREVKNNSSITGSESNSSESSRERERNDESNRSTSGTENTNGNRNESANGKETNTSNGMSERDSTDKYSDTPQGAITGLANDTYLTNARMIDSSENNSASENKANESTNESEYSDEKERTENELNKGKENESETVNNSGNILRNNREENTGNSSTDRGTTESNTGKRNEKESASINSIEAYAEKVSGKRGSMSYSKMLEEFRNTFLNIDKMIIDELSDCFFGLYE